MATPSFQMEMKYTISLVSVPYLGTENDVVQILVTALFREESETMSNLRV